MPIHCVGEEPRPNSQPKPALSQLHAFPSDPITHHQKAENEESFVPELGAKDRYIITFNSIF